jgi:hypothetical protein
LPVMVVTSVSGASSPPSAHRRQSYSEPAEPKETGAL